jgi:hypothetical protein
MKKRFTRLDVFLAFLAGAAVSVYLVLLWLLSLECSCGAL